MKKALITLSIIALAATAAQAQTTIYSTNFNTPTYIDGAIIGQDSWAITGTSTVNPINVANTATNGNVTLAATGQDVNRPFTAQTAAATGSVWLSFDLNLTAANATGDYFIHLDDGTTTGFSDRVFAKAGAAGTFDLALGTGSGTPAAAAYGADLAFGSYHIVARYDFVSGAANDTGALFVNPVDPFGVGDTAYMAAVTQGTDAPQIAGANLRQGTTGPAGVVIDNISVASSPAAAIPEPATWMLMGVGLLVGVTKRFRRNS